jgi:(hydroxyamino)benzene mutase
MFGLLWPRLRFGNIAARVAFWCLLYSALSIDLAYAMGAVWGAGNETIRQAAGTAHGSEAQELAIMIAAYSSAPTGIASFILIFLGLRLPKQ